MGISLSGLTPATTFDGLLKVGDNEPLDGTLKAISTGEGTDTILSLSDSALGIGGDVTITGTTDDNTASALTINNSLDSALFSVNNEGRTNFHKANWYTYTAGPTILRSTNSGGFRFYTGGDAMEIQSTGIGIGTNSPTSKLHVKGSGATSATTSLLVQNSAGSELFKLTDDGTINLGVPGDNPTIQSGSNAGKSLTLGSTATLSALNINLSTYNGINYTPVLSVTGNTDQFVGIGETTPTARLHVKGAGNDNTTTSLLVQNSDGTELLKVQDDGTINARQSITVNHATNSLRKLRLGWGSVYAEDNSSELIIGAVYSLNTSPKITLGGNTRSSGADAILAQALNGMYIAPTASTEDPSAQLHIKGSGDTSATTALLVQNSVGDDLFKLEDGGLIDIGGSSGYTIQSNLFSPKINGYIALDRNSNRNFSIVDNAASRTYLKVQSSLTSDFADVSINTDHLVVKKEGVIGIGETTPTARLQVKGSGNDATTTALLVQNSDGNDLLKVTDDGSATAVSFKTSAMTINANQILSASNIKLRNLLQANGGTSISTADGAPANTMLYVKGFGNDATTTALLVQNSDGDELLKVDDNGASYFSDSLEIGADYINGLQRIGTVSGMSIGNTRFYRAANTQLHIKGSGATSATTALLVQNSAGTDLMKVGDDGLTIIKSALITANTHLAQYVSGTNWYIHVNGSTTIGRGSSAVASAVLEVDSTTKGFLPPRMTDAERDAITNPAAGLMIYDTSNNQMNYWNGSTWIAF